MKKTILFGIAIVTAFVVGALSANPEVGAVSGWQAAVIVLQDTIDDIEFILFNITGVDCPAGKVVSGYNADGTPICISNIEIMRIDGGQLSTIATTEVYFLDGEERTNNDASDFEFASKMVGIDGTIREVQYKIGISEVDEVSVTAKLYKNNVKIDECTFSTSTSSHTSCTMTTFVDGSVVKGDLLAMSDISDQRIDVEGKSAFVVITPSS